MTNLTRSPAWRAAAVGLAGSLAVSGAVAVASPASAVEGFTLERLQGQNRYETAAAIATSSFASSGRVVLASGEQRNFPDALTGNYLAGFAAAPIVLTETARLPQPTLQALRDLSAQRVTIIGGVNAVSQDVENSLERAGYTVDRIAGQNRYDTAQKVGQSIPNSYVGSVGGRRTAILGNGQNFPDILAASPASFEAQLPITITQPDSLPAQTESELRELNIEQVIIVGGTDAVSTNVENRVDQIVDRVRRIQGAGRYETARAIADFAVAELGFVTTHVNLARGDAFPDALAGGPHAGRDRSVILLTPPTSLAPAAEGFLEAHDCSLRDGHIFGGSSAVSQSVEDRAEQVARTCEDGQPTAGFSVTPDTSQTFTCTANPDSTTADDRTYTVSGLEQGVEYRVTLFEASTISGSGTASSPHTFTDTDNDNRAETGTVSADVTAVNGAAPQNNAGAGTAVTTNDVNNSQTAVFTARSDGTATVTVDGSGAGESFRPVVFINGGSNNAAEDGGQSPRLELNDDNTAAEPFDLGGVTTCAGVSAESATVRPELVSAAVLSTSTDATATATSVRFTFDETVTVADVAQFQVYFANGALADDAGDAATTEGNTVVVTFNAVDATNATNLSLATVDVGAVRDSSDLLNPIGDASLGNEQTEAQPGGITVAPDLLSVENFRAGATANTTAVDFTFDEAAFVLDAGGFALIRNDGREFRGGVVRAGLGTETITVEFPNDGTSPFSRANVARGTVDDATVSDAPQSGATPPIEGNANVLQAADVGNNGNTTLPDLVSVELRPNPNTTAGDQALFVFDQAVALDDASNPLVPEEFPERFRLYKIDRTVLRGVAAEVVSPDFRQVLVTFAQADAAVNAVGGSVEDDAVFAANAEGNPAGSPTSPAPGNEQDEVAIADTTANDVRVPGRTAAPDLVSVRLAAVNDSFRATYSFDEAVRTNPVTRQFALYQADGSRLIATSCATGTTTSGANQNNNTVTCTAYVVDANNNGVIDTGEPQATSAQISAATLGTVDNGAVLALDNAAANPEGAEFTTGGTGTRAA